MRDDEVPVPAARGAAAQILKQRLTVQQTEVGLLELPDLRARAAVGEPAHEIGVLALP